MSIQKTEYLNRIRKETKYHYLREVACWFDKWGKRFNYVLVIVGGICLWGMLGGDILLGICGLSMILIGILNVYICDLIHGAAIALADMADSVIDLNCRYETPNQ